MGTVLFVLFPGHKKPPLFGNGCQCATGGTGQPPLLYVYFYRYYAVGLGADGDSEAVSPTVIHVILG